MNYIIVSISCNFCGSDMTARMVLHKPTAEDIEETRIQKGICARAYVISEEELYDNEFVPAIRGEEYDKS